jgi:hypothetical protein
VVRVGGYLADILLVNFIKKLAYCGNNTDGDLGCFHCED